MYNITSDITNDKSGIIDTSFSFLYSLYPKSNNIKIFRRKLFRRNSKFLFKIQYFRFSLNNRTVMFYS